MAVLLKITNQDYFSKYKIYKMQLEKSLILPRQLLN